MKDSETELTPRVAELVRQIRAGSRWERTTVDNQRAIRLTSSGGTETIALTDDEEFEFLAAIGGSIRIQLPK